MLVHLAIRNLAVIERTELEFTTGLNVLTGETGAGKSIVVGALNLVLGDRARSDTIRSGAPRAEVQALFRLPPDSPAAGRLRQLDLLEQGDDSDGAELLIRRIVAAGKGRVYINGVLSTVGTLAEVTRGLVDISSQHQHTELLNTEGHLALLDRFGGLDAQGAAYAERWAALERARAARRELARREQARAEREDWLRFQLDEIERVAPKPGEDAELQVEHARLAHAERLLEGAREAEARCSGEEVAAGDQLNRAVGVLEGLVGFDPSLEEPLERLRSAAIEVEDVAYELRRYGQQIEADPWRLEQVEARLTELDRLKRKHGGELARVLEHGQELAAELAGFESLELDLREARDREQAELEGARAAAARLSEARQAVAVELSQRVTAELAGLAMTGASVRFELRPLDELAPTGGDDGEILIRTNAGEEHRPIARIASGGELSRLLLAVKRALAHADSVATIVFDEVDTGVGGAVAEVIGRKLREIAVDRQVITITHLPQIAAQARHHLKVEKLVGAEGRATTSVLPLLPAARTDEIARMLGGVDITERTLAHAEELLELAD